MSRPNQRNKKEILVERPGNSSRATSKLYAESLKKKNWISQLNLKGGKGPHDQQMTNEKDPPPPATLLQKLQQLALVGLLERVWPAERVVVGLRVCKLLKNDLEAHVEKVLLKAHDSDKTPAKDISRSLLRFKNKRVILLGRRDPWLAGKTNEVIKGVCGTATHDFGKGLLRIDLGGNRLEHHDDLKQLAKILEMTTDLTHLVLDSNGFGEKGAAILEPSLRRCTRLTLLDLSATRLFSKGMLSLAPALDVCTSLRYLDISQNHIGERGATRVAASLRRTTALTHLCVANNNIGDTGAEHVVVAIGQCHQLRHLDLSANEVGSDTAARVLCGLGGCTALTQLSLDARRVQELAQIPSSLTSLRCLCMRTTATTVAYRWHEGTKAWH